MLIDASVHPTLDDDELKRRIGKPWSNGRLPNLFGTRYQPPFDEIVVPLEQAGDPDATAEELFGRRGVDAAIVAPLSRGLLPNPQQGAAIVRGINEWVAERWLPAAAGRYFGSIRVPVTDVAAAVTEIERWAGDPRFVQVVVPLRVFLPFGDDYYFPIWEAAVRHDLPVAVFDDDATVVEHHETPVGALRYFSEKHALRPLASVVHIASLVTCGVFDRLPRLRVIIGDGSVDVARVMMWRVDRDWRQGRVEIPWVQKLPSSYMADHVRFVSQAEDGTNDGFSVDGEQVRISDAENLVLFGSHYPYWDDRLPEDVLPGLPPQTRERVLAANALSVLPRLASQLAAAG